MGKELKPITKIGELLTSMGKSYHWYYTHDYDLSMEQKVCEKFDNRMKTDKDFNNFVSKVVIVRGDPISSDREVLAFMKAFKKLGGEKVFYSLTKEDYLATIDEISVPIWYGKDWWQKARDSISKFY